MKDSELEWVGKIPIEWEKIKLKYSAECNREVLSETESADLEIDYIDIGSVSYTHGIEIVQRFRFSDAPSRARRIVHTGDTILSTVRTYLKALAFITKEFDGCICSTGFAVYSPNHKCIARYLYYALSVDWFVSTIESVSKGISYPAINSTELSNLKIILPPVNEQYYIADFLDRKCAQIDSAIKKQQAIIEKLKAYKQSVITEAVTKGLNPDVPMKDSGIEWIGDIPQNWATLKLKYCTYIRARLGWKGLKAEEYVEIGYPLLSAFNIVNEKLSFNSLNFINQLRYEESPEIKLSLGDILLVKDGAGIGKCALVKYLPMPSTVNGSIAVITVRDIASAYLYYYFESKVFLKYIDLLKDGMGVPHLFQSDLREIQIPVPTDQEQKAITAKLDEVTDRLDAALEQRQIMINKLNEYKKSLIYEAVTGKIEVPQ